MTLGKSESLLAVENIWFKDTNQSQLDIFPKGFCCVEGRYHTRVIQHSALKARKRPVIKYICARFSNIPRGLARAKPFDEGIFLKSSA